MRFALRRPRVLLAVGCGLGKNEMGMTAWALEVVVSSGDSGEVTNPPGGWPGTPAAEPGEWVPAQVLFLGLIHRAGGWPGAQAEGGAAPWAPQLFLRRPTSALTVGNRTAAAAPVPFRSEHPSQPGVWCLPPATHSFPAASQGTPTPTPRWGGQKGGLLPLPAPGHLSGPRCLAHSSGL